MAKRKRRHKQRPERTEAVATAEYRDDDGNVLALRTSLSAGTIRKIGEAPKAGASLDDAWQRRAELLFERLAVSWEIAGLPLTEQAMLLARYRMADAQTRRWVQRTLAGHLERHLPELAP